MPVELSPDLFFVFTMELQRLVCSLIKGFSLTGSLKLLVKLSLDLFCVCLKIKLFLDSYFQYFLVYFLILQVLLQLTFVIFFSL